MLFIRQVTNAASTWKLNSIAKEAKFGHGDAGQLKFGFFMDWDGRHNGVGFGEIFKEPAIQYRFFSGISFKDFMTWGQ